MMMPLRFYAQKCLRSVTNKTNLRCLSTSNSLFYLWEQDPKAGYVDRRPQPSKIQLIRDGLKELKHEIAVWKNEVIERFENDPTYLYRPGETDVLWKFGDEKALDQWVVSSDSDHNEGYSSCSLKLNKQGKGMFSGFLSTKVPQDGRTKRAGYCNITTLRARRSFKRDSYHNWTAYNMLVLKVRGDGRSYLLNLSTKGYFDVTWHDAYHYVLYTRGGPYWQITKIPFSKFFLSSKGRIQDKQYPLPLDRIASFGISAGDKYNGPFQLEIDYVGVEYDPNHTEEFAYEMYEVPKYIVG